MESNSKGTYVTVVVIVAVVVLGVIMWWLQGNITPVSTDTTGTSSSTTQVVPGPASDTTANIQSDLDQIDTGSTTQDMQKIDADINSL